MSRELHSTGYRIVTHLMLLGATFFWGINPMLMKVGLRELSPLHFNLLRLIIALIITIPFVLAEGGFARIRKADIPRFAAVSVFGFFIFQIGYSYGVNYTSASVSSILLGLLPISVVIINRLIGNRDITKLKLLGVAGTLVGVVLIALGKYSGLSLADTYISGVLLLVVAELGYGTYTVVVKPLTAHYSVSQIIAVIIAVSIVMFALFSIPTLSELSLTEISPLTYLTTATSGLLALSVGNMLWSAGIKRIGSVNTSVYGNLPPVFGVAAGLLVLGESLSPLQILGALVILGGVFLVNSRRASAAPPDPSHNSLKDNPKATDSARTKEPTL
ncbi:MAG: DMT family transporter [Spirochaetaceae bacterium]